MSVGTGGGKGEKGVPSGRGKERVGGEDTCVVGGSA